MKRLTIIAVLGLMTSFSAQAKTLQCDFNSDYTFSQQGRTLIFSQAATPGKRIMIQDGRMVIDGKEQALSSQDKQSVTEFENEVRLLIPQVKQVSIEAVGIAFTALIEVSRSLSGEQNNSTVVKLQHAQVQLINALSKDPTIAINGNIDEKVIEPIVTDFVPDIVSAAVKHALSMAFSGDEAKSQAFEARMDKMGDDLDAQLEARTKNLEPLANAMCDRIRHLDQIENSFGVRLDNNKQLNLLETKAP